MADELEIRKRGDLLVLRLRVSPAARRRRVTGLHAGALKLQVTEPPERGKANQGVIRLLSEVLGIPAANLSILSGATGRDKKLGVAGFEGDESRLQAAVLKAVVGTR